MTPRRPGRIVFINQPPIRFTHYSLLISADRRAGNGPSPAARSARPTARSWRWRPGCSCFYGLLSLPQGWLVQRFGRKAMMAAFFSWGNGRWPDRRRPWRIHQRCWRWR